MHYKNTLRTLCMRFGFLILVAMGRAAEVDQVVDSAIKVELNNGFCNKTLNRLECNFRSTNKSVILERIGLGIQEVKLESLTTFRGLPPCGTHLLVWSSRNVTLLGLDAEEPIENVDRSAVHWSHSRETVNEWKPIHFPGGSSGDRQCVGNASVYQSEMRLLQGNFDKVSLQSTKLQNASGMFNNLVIKQSQVSGFSVSSVNMTAEKVFFQTVREMNITNDMQLHQVNIATVDSPGITLLPASEHSEISSLFNVLENVKIGSLKPGKILVKNSSLFMNGVIINVIGTGGISVEASEATFTNVVIKQGPISCLVLRGESQIILNNFTLGKKTIDHLKINTKSRWPLYPLLAQTSPERPQVKIAPLQNSTDVDGIFDEGFIGLHWYWVPIMTVVGLVSGMVIGCAVRCSQRPPKSKEMSSLSFSELVARERHEGNRCSELNRYVGPHRPEFVRQDSGLTSSSFASYTACSDRRHSSVRQIEDTEHTLMDTSEPNVFIHVPSVACTRESVIYEECEALPPPPTEQNLYVPMGGHLKCV